MANVFLTCAGIMTITMVISASANIVSTGHVSSSLPSANNSECRCSCPEIICPVEKEISYIYNDHILTEISRIKGETCIGKARAKKKQLDELGYSNFIYFVRVNGSDEGHVINGVLLYIDNGIIEPDIFRKNYCVIKMLSSDEIERDNITLKDYYAEKWRGCFDE